MRYGHANIVLLGRAGIVTVRALVPKSAPVRETGLRGVRTLPPGIGMLFTFNAHQPRVLTMRGMEIPLDILWLGADRVLDVVRALPGQQRLVGPNGTLAALEVVAGFAAGHGIRAGQVSSVAITR